MRKALLIALLLGRTMVGPAYAEPINVEIISADKLIALGKQRLEQQGAGTVGFPIPLGPKEYDKPYTGLLNIVKADDYSVLRSLCNSKTAVACAVRSETSCLIMLGPMVHNSERALKHELFHCNGWPSNHPNPRYE